MWCITQRKVAQFCFLKREEVGLPARKLANTWPRYEQIPGAHLPFAFLIPGAYLPSSLISFLCFVLSSQPVFVPILVLLP